MFDESNSIVEYELEREKWNLETKPETVPTAAKSKLGCLSIFVYFILGILVFRIFGELLNFLF